MRQPGWPARPAMVAILLGAWSAVGGAAPAGDADGPARAWQALLAQTQPAGQDEAVERVLRACGGDLKALQALIAADTGYAQFRPGWMRRTVRVEVSPSDASVLKLPPAGRSLEVEFHVRVPRGYSPTKSWAVVLAAHGQGGEGLGIGEMVEALLGPAREQYLIVAPTMPGPAHFSGKRYQEDAYLLPLAWARWNLNADDDRIHVVGYSQGGHVAWHLAVMHPRLFASAVPMAGVPWFEGSPYVNDSYLPNVMNLPVWAVWGEKDRADPSAAGTVDIMRLTAATLARLGKKDFIGTELPGVGHGGCFPKPEEFAAFLARCRRRATPEEFRHNFHLAHHGRGYYLEAAGLTHAAMDFDRPASVALTVPPGEKPTTQAVVDQVRQRLEKVMFEMSARLWRADNALAIRTRGVSGVRVYVTEGLFDLSRPVTIQRDGRTWRGRVPASARCVLVGYLRQRDATAPVYNELLIETDGRVTLRYPAP